MGNDVETLRRWFHDIYTRGGGCIGHHFETDPAQCERWAKGLLASDWLAARDAELRESIAAEIEALTYPFDNLGYNAIWKAGVEAATTIARGAKP